MLNKIKETEILSINLANTKNGFLKALILTDY